MYVRFGTYDFFPVTSQPKRYPFLFPTVDPHPCQYILPRPLLLRCQQRQGVPLSFPFATSVIGTTHTHRRARESRQTYTHTYTHIRVHTRPHTPLYSLAYAQTHTHTNKQINLKIRLISLKITNPSMTHVSTVGRRVMSGEEFDELLSSPHPALPSKKLSEKLSKKKKRNHS